ncbi:hypothetical protein NDA11_006500 [Ustilago hordei]|uniref:Probable MADS-box homolog Umc1 n=1 Tax=Ustilago hordei TaxID=120017 RepID=I2G5H4_USTHO|nr:MADS-box containing transcription factor [Ustilago hordei]KAJ1039290.1 hypothetical protein NDA10_002528 [Ustilago hordei]KAJ1586179.1 hypothetical protein NDA12_005605 [Ustilago hordei]KAJ1589320.1 hypothetical protein NDA15_004451 [Ustilago hordei]KAJ1591142.1 hypothetical protein NDA11_006500 [Ustilago hordei]KAJ1600586.1 hypothetical protein NDA14_001634 [Ustilago hordei]
MSSLSAGVVGVRQQGSSANSPIYQVPFGTVQLASSSKDSDGNFDLAAGFSAPADFENQEEQDDEEGDDDDDDDDGDSEDGGKGKGKKGKRSHTEAKGERDLKTGRRKIKIEFIQGDARRHITFSKRKAGIMKKAYELATLTGTQVLLLVVSQTGLVYTFTTPKLQALVTQAEGRNLIQACLNAPDPPNGAGESGGEQLSGEEASDGDGGLSPSGSQASSNKRAAQNRKRPRTNSTGNSSKASASAVVAEDDATAASGSQLGTAKRGRGRPRKNTAGRAASYADNAANTAPATDATLPMPPPPMHQSYSDDAVHHHHQPQYIHVPSAEFNGYNAGGFYGDTSAAAGNHDLNFGQQQAHTANGLTVDANQAAWNQTMSPSTNTQNMFSNDPHQQHHHHQQQQQQQPPSVFNYGSAAANFGHFNPQQLASMQAREIQAPRPAW